MVALLSLFIGAAFSVSLRSADAPTDAQNAVSLASEFVTAFQEVSDIMRSPATGFTSNPAMFTLLRQRVQTIESVVARFEISGFRPANWDIRTTPFEVTSILVRQVRSQLPMVLGVSDATVKMTLLDALAAILLQANKMAAFIRQSNPGLDELPIDIRAVTLQDLTNQINNARPH